MYYVYMTKTSQVPYYVDTVEELNSLPEQSVVVIQESEHGDHVAWQLTADILKHKNFQPEDDEYPDKAWASSYYKLDHDSGDLLTMSYKEKDRALVVYIHPA